MESITLTENRPEFRSRVKTRYRDITPIDYAKLLSMPSPFLRSTGGPQRQFYCSLCKIKFETEVPSLPKSALVRTQEGALPELSKKWQSAIKDAKTALQKEWDEHLCNVHPRQWEREQKKRARPRARGQ